jgi:hypothetical protein
MGFTRVSSGLYLKQTTLERPSTDKHSNSLQTCLNYGRKKFQVPHIKENRGLLLTPRVEGAYAVTDSLVEEIML